MNKHDEEFEQRARTALDSGVTALDAETRSRLAAGRARAFERKSWAARWLFPSGSWMPATAFAACAVLAVTLYVTNRQPAAPLQMAQADTDFALELLLGTDGEDEDADENGPEATGPDFYIRMEAMILQEEEEKNAG